jgi:hypothetical protein
MRPPAHFLVLLLTGAAALGADALRPRLQILNGTAQRVEVFWLKSDKERVANGAVAPGEDSVITTTIGHRFAVVGREGGAETIVESALPVQAVRLGGVPAFYAQSASAGGYPIVASEKVNPFALKEAAHLVDLMLARRPDVRRAMILSGSRLCILAWNEFTTDQPEFARLGERPHPTYPQLPGKDAWDARARGLGGSTTDPFCSCAEENLLGYPGDPYAAECILIHEFAHNIHLRGMVNVDTTFDRRLKSAYDAAMKAGLWRGKYASVNHHEYFAEGVQSWFDNNRENDVEHNHVNTRAELLEYDPGLAAMCREVFGDTEIKYTKPATRLTGHLAGYDPAKAPTFVWPERLLKAKEVIKQHTKARAAMRFDPVVRDVEGWKVHVEPALLEGEHRDEGARALAMLGNHLMRIKILLAPEPLARMQAMELWIEHSHPVLQSKQYHPSRDWLLEHGHDPRLERKVHIPRARDLLSREQMLKHPAVILHELAHAYHDQVLGFDHPEIVAAYEKARAAGIYENVLLYTGRRVKHYGLSNAKEYFAEATEAFFYRNDFYPFVRAELQEHDPEMCALLARLWQSEGAPTR